MAVQHSNAPEFKRVRFFCNFIKPVNSLGIFKVIAAGFKSGDYIPLDWSVIKDVETLNKIAANRKMALRRQKFIPYH